MLNGNGGILTIGEKCICELCECGHHHCPHIDELRQPLEVSREFASSSEYARAFTAKHGADLEPSASSVQQMFGGGGTLLDKPGGGFLGESTHQRDFVPWLGVKPAENAVLARLADSDEDHPLKRSRPIPFLARSTHQTDFTAKHVEPVQQIRRASTFLARSGTQLAPFLDQSTHRADFTRLGSESPSTAGKQQHWFPGASGGLYDSHLGFERRSTDRMETMTTHQRDFREFPLQMTMVNDMMRTNGNGEGGAMTMSRVGGESQSCFTFGAPFFAETDYRANFDRKAVELMSEEKSCQQQAKTTRSDEGPLVRLAGPFAASTTYSMDFKRLPELWICPAEMVLTRKDKHFKFSRQDRRGHVFYRRGTPPNGKTCVIGKNGENKLKNGKAEESKHSL